MGISKIVRDNHFLLRYDILMYYSLIENEKEKVHLHIDGV